MKKYILIVILLLNFTLTAFANSFDELTELENGIFGYDYKSESNLRRLERLEKHLYGEKRGGNIDKRIECIKNDIGYTVKQVENVKPANNGDVDKKANQITEDKNTDNKKLTSSKEDTSVEYPVVDKLEEEIFKTTYKHDNIYDRLDRLEEKVFSKKSNEDLNIRVDNLASVVMPKLVKKDRFKDYSSQEIDKYYQIKGYSPVDDDSLSFELSALETDLLKKDYNEDTTTKRLGRLEEKLFKKTFSSDTDITRLQRLLVAYDAKKDSSKYETNKRMQNVAAASQIGGILLLILAMLL